MKYGSGWWVWMAAIALAFTLPGSVWHPASAPAFPWASLLPMSLVLVTLSLAAPALSLWLGPTGAQRGLLALLEAPPDFLWGGLLLATWPSHWESPGLAAFGMAFLAAALPSEVRWLCSALPTESPFPAAYGSAAVLGARRIAILHLLPRWFAARLPLWLTAALILERIFGIQGLGSDWLQRIATRDRAGIAAWMLGFALLWRVTRAWERR